MPSISASGHRVTSIDVARRAGVSQSTVSLVLSGKGRGRISARTEAAVREAAEELGYRPNQAARALRTGAARTVGFVVPDVTQPVFGRVLRGAQQAAWSAGYAVALVDAGRDRGAEIASVEALRAGPADGLLLFNVEPPPGVTAHLVIVDAASDAFPVVRLDSGAGTAAAVRHLAGLGHRRFGHLAAAPAGATFRLREEALAAVLLEAGLAPAARSRSDFALDAARDAALTLLDTGCTALVADDDTLAAGAYLAVRERGLAIPGDVSIAGFDDLDVARVLDPPLTTVAIDPEGLGARAFAALAADLAGEPVPREQVLPVKLVVRASTGPPRA